MPARLPLGAHRLVVVTGKGGVGKTTVAAALAHAAARAGRRVLAVEVGRGRLGPLLGAERLGHEPRRIVPGLAGATIEPEQALADFLHGVLRFRVLARRLLESTTFQVLAAAAPGLQELLVLHRLHGWIGARKLGRPVHELVVVDAPASGHSLPLLEAPQALRTLARLGPVAELLRDLDRLLHDPERTLVCLVTTPEELAVRETVELHRAVAERVGLRLAPVVVNAVPARMVGRADEAALARLDAAHPWVEAARLHVARRRQAAVQIDMLRRTLRAAPIRLPFLSVEPGDPRTLEPLADALADATGLAA